MMNCTTGNYVIRQSKKNTFKLQKIEGYYYAETLSNLPLPLNKGQKQTFQKT